MGELARKRVRFTRKFARLLNHAEVKGDREGFYPVVGRVKMPEGSPGVHPRSTHFSGLAGHIILYDRNFNWLHNVNPEWEKKVYRELHAFWEFLCGQDETGKQVVGELIEGDLNHFSFEHEGVR